MIVSQTAWSSRACEFDHTGPGACLAPPCSVSATSIGDVTNPPYCQGCRCLDNGSGCGTELKFAGIEEKMGVPYIILGNLELRGLQSPQCYFAENRCTGQYDKDKLLRQQSDYIHD